MSVVIVAPIAIATVVAPIVVAVVVTVVAVVAIASVVVVAVAGHGLACAAAVLFHFRDLMALGVVSAHSYIVLTVYLRTVVVALVHVP